MTTWHYWAFHEHSRARPAARRIALEIARWADDHGRRRVTQEELAQALGLSVRQVQRAIAELRRLGELKVVRTQDGNVYRLLSEKWDRTKTSHVVRCSVTREYLEFLDSENTLTPTEKATGSLDTENTLTSTENVTGSISLSKNQKPLVAESAGFRRGTDAAHEERLKASSEGKGEQTIQQTTLIPEPADELFDRWQQVFDKPKAKLTPARRRAAVRVLREESDLDTLLVAMKGFKIHRRSKEGGVELSDIFGTYRGTSDLRSRIEWMLRLAETNPEEGLSVQKFMERFSPRMKDMALDWVSEINAMLRTPTSRSLVDVGQARIRRFERGGWTVVIEGERVIGFRQVEGDGCAGAEKPQAAVQALPAAASADEKA